MVISRDIWLKDRGGQEHHVRVNQDIPVRVGQEIALIYARGEKKSASRPAIKQSGLVSVYVVSTDRTYTVWSLGDIAAKLARPYVSPSRAWVSVLAWPFSVFLCLVYGLGLLLLGYLAISLARQRRQIRADAAAISKELQVEHKRLLNSVYAEHQTRLVASRTSAQPQLQAKEAT